MNNSISKLFMSAIIACSFSASMAQWTVTGNVVAPTTLTNNLSVGTTTNGANIYVEKSTAVTLGIKSQTAGATMFMDKGSATANAAFAYRLLGTTMWNTGMLGGNNYSIRNVVNGTVPLVVTQSDQVGIGTLSPVATLDVRANNGSIIVGTPGSTGGAIYLGNQSHGFQRGFPTINANNDIGLYTTAGSLYLSTHNNTTGDFILTSNGDVGIGTSAPATKLDIAGKNNWDLTNTPGDLRLGNATYNIRMGIALAGGGAGFAGISATNSLTLGTGSTAPNLSTLIIQNGKVGIGNNSPVQKLDVTGNIQATGILIADAANSNTGVIGDNNLKFGGITSGEAIASKRTPGGNQYGLDFFTGSNKSLAITYNGLVGIGVDVPTENFQVNAAAAGGTRTVISNSGTGNVGLELRSAASPSTQFIDFQDGATNNNSPDFRNRIASTPSNLSFSTNAKANAMVIANNGKVGIGTTSPANTLSVIGNTSLDGDLYIRNNSNAAYYGQMINTGNFHLDTYGPTGNMYLNYFDGDAVFVGNGALGIVASFLPNGNVGIGTTTPSYKLDVCGTIRSKEVRVETNWCDYVFANDYHLRPLSEVETFIKENKHLPEVTPGVEIETNGLEVGKVSAQMIKKIEELTLYAIAQQKMIETLQLKVEALKVSKK